MCLDTVDEETKQVTEGWKVFEIVNNELHSIYFDTMYKIKKWIFDDKEYTLKSVNDKLTYQTGFHFYLNKIEAEYIAKHMSANLKITFKALNIKVKDVVATGKQYNFIVGVAKNIYIKQGGLLK